jgi:hypothetical protein
MGGSIRRNHGMALLDQSARLIAPAWVNKPVFDLPEPWFMVPGEAMRNWQLVESPAPFRMRQIFADASIVSRA